MRLTFTICLLLSICSYALGQEESLRGKVIDAKTGFPVPYASVLIKNKSRGIGATGEGKFRFPIENGDTLQISSIGYETLTLSLNFDEIDFSKENIFKLSPTVYELDSIEVIQLSDDFYLKRPKRDTLSLGIYKPSQIRDWNKIQTIPYMQNGEIGMVITGIFNDFDKKIQQEKIIKAFEESEAFKIKRQEEREKYFNKELVKRVTRIDDRVIDEFMEFCNFLDGQIIGKSEYEVTLLILKKYKAFLIR